MGKTNVADETNRSSAGRKRVFFFLFMITMVCVAALVVFTLAAPEQGEEFTEFYILGEGKIADNYPDFFSRGEPQEVFIGIYNHEYADMRYVVEIFLIQEELDDVTNTSSLQKMELQDTYVVDLQHNETDEKVYSFSVDSTEYNKLQLLLFENTAPSEEVWGMDRINASYRDVHLWMHVLR